MCAAHSTYSGETICCCCCEISVAPQCATKRAVPSANRHLAAHEPAVCILQVDMLHFAGYFSATAAAYMVFSKYSLRFFAGPGWMSELWSFGWRERREDAIYTCADYTAPGSRARRSSRACALVILGTELRAAVAAEIVQEQRKQSATALICVLLARGAWSLSNHTQKSYRLLLALRKGP